MDSSLLRDEDQLMAKKLFEGAEKDKVVFIEAAASGDDESNDDDDTTSDDDEAADSDDDEPMDDDSLRKKTFVRNNILHIAIRYGQYDSIKFICKAVSKFPHLMREQNSDGNTPLHFAAESDDVFGTSYRIIEELCEFINDDDLEPLRIKNSMGNTVLHVAIIHNRLNAARILVKKDPSLVNIVNNSDEAPLHLALKYFPDVTRPEGVVDEKQKEFIRLMNLNGRHWNAESRKTTGPELKMGMMIGLLLEKASHVAGWRDASGLTPLHIAASLSTSYNLQVIKFMIDRCPPSIEVSDTSGKTILHHLINRVDFLHEVQALAFWETDLPPPMTRMGPLANHQDQQGNTPAHLSAIEGDLVMLEKLQPITNQLLKNKEGRTLSSLWMRKFFHEGYGMREEICRPAERGDLVTLTDYVKGLDVVKSRDSNGRSVVSKLFLIKSGHVVIPKLFIHFIDHVTFLSRHGEYGGHPLCHTDKDGDTPFHILAQLNPDNIMIHYATEGTRSSTPIENPYPGPKPDDLFFNLEYRKERYEWGSLGKTKFFSDLVEYGVKFLSSHEGEWLKQNVKGNTILHEALIAKNVLVFIKFAELENRATTLVNKRKETLLHLLAAWNPIPEDIMNQNVIIETIIRKITQDEERNLLDEDGLSPLMRAIKASNFAFADKLCSVCPRLAEVRGHNGQTFWHLLVDAPRLSSFSDFNVPQEGFDMLVERDKDEKTALHLAIERKNFVVAQIFLSLTSDGTHNFNTRLLGIPNKEGDTPGHMIGSLPYLPPKFEEFIWKDSTMIGTRSMWGVPTTQMKDYVNTMGVIAALLTTITFTTAFTVPGGLDQVKGTPLLVKNLAFQVFIISDVLAMCLSMMVLFCLMWIIATGEKSKSVVLLDFSIILLLASFYTTMLTFMTGLYATLHLVKPWIAIFSLVPCSMLLLLVHKKLVIKLIVPTGKHILIFVRVASRYAKHAFCRTNEIPVVTREPSVANV